MSHCLDMVHGITPSCKGVWKSDYLNFSASMVRQANKTGIKNNCLTVQ